jgi:hypothetical protein
MFAPNVEHTNLPNSVENLEDRGRNYGKGKGKLSL